MRASLVIASVGFRVETAEMNDACRRAAPACRRSPSSVLTSSELPARMLKADASRSPKFGAVRHLDDRVPALSQLESELRLRRSGGRQRLRRKTTATLSVLRRCSAPVRAMPSVAGRVRGSPSAGQLSTAGQSATQTTSLNPALMQQALPCVL